MNAGRIVALCACVGAARGSAQSATMPVGWYFDRLVSERWINAGQRDATVPVSNARALVKIDSLRGTPEQRTIFFTSGNWDQAQVTTDAKGRVTALRGATGTPPRTTDPASLIRFARMGQGRDAVSLPEAQVWDLAATFRPRRVAPGERWVDTLDFDVSIDGYRQALHAVRHNTIVRDTMVDGHVAWIVRDSARARYIERWPSDDEVANQVISVERDVTGVVLGEELYDPMLRLFRTRDDTARFAGTESAFYPRNQVFRAPTRYERLRHFALEDSAMRVNATKARVVARPDADSMRKLAANRATIFDRRLAEGDTAAAIAFLALDGIGITPQHQLDTPKLQLLLPVLNDPARALSLHTNLRYLYGDIGGSLVTKPMVLTSDTGAWPCTPDACRLLASQWTAARDTRLRNLGLLAHFALDPRTWNDTLRQHAASDSAFFSGAMSRSLGIATTWAAGSHAPMPPTGAAWPAWLEWMNGRSPAYPAFVLPGRDTTPNKLSVRFDQSHTLAVMFTQALTERNLPAEWQEQLAATANDSARLVFKTMLIGMNAYHGDTADIAARLIGGSGVERNAAIKEVVALFGPAAAPFVNKTGGPAADSATTAEIQDRFLEIALDHMPFWAPLPPGPRTGAVRSFLEAPRNGDSIFVIANELDPSLRLKWGGRARIVYGSAWRPASDSFKVTYYAPSRVARVGPFVRVTLDYGFDSPGSGHIAPRSGVFAGSTTVYLMRTTNGWVVVTEQGWLT